MRDNSLDCKKCGSLLKNYTRVGDCLQLESEWACDNINCENFDVRPFETQDRMKYQQRLDNVLSKFENKSVKWEYYEYELGYQVDIIYADKTFHLNANNHEHILSLDTVEHLLKDLEVK